MGIRIEPKILNTVLLIVDLFYDSLNIVLRLILIRVWDLFTGRWHDDDGLVLQDVLDRYNEGLRVVLHTE